MYIWKYEIPIQDFFEIEMPKDSEVLCVQVQRGKPCIWVRVVDPNNLKVKKAFAIVGTGQAFNDNEYFYVGSFQQDCGYLVWHLFEDVCNYF
jgi:hypothetical protein